MDSETQNFAQNINFNRNKVEKLILLAFLMLALIIASFMLWQNTTILIINVLIEIILIILIINILLKKQTLISFTKQNRLSTKQFLVFFWAITTVAVLVRTILFTIIPAGLNADEASMLYDAYSLGKYGIDRNGHSFPVYLEAWGGGQNALLTYLTIPFVLAYGMNIFSARIVTLIFSFISIFAFYYLIKLLTNNKTTALVCMALFALCPYTIMISRWGLESNLFPHFLLYGIICLVKTYQKHIGYIFPACLLLGISLYAYAIAYMIVPLLLIGVYVFFFLKKTINKNNFVFFITSNLLLFILALPLILFLMVNNGWLNEIHCGVLTITKMRDYRGGEISISNIGYNLLLVPTIIFTQSDAFLHNSMFNLGILYLITTPLFLIKIIKTWKKIFQKQFKFEDLILVLWLSVSILTALLIRNPNINKLNSIWFVLIIFAGIELYEFAKNSKTLIFGFIFCFTIMFTTFCGIYFTTYNTQNAVNFNDGLTESINYAKQLASNDKLIYFSKQLHEPYIYCLLVDEKSPNNFLQTREFSNPTTIKSYNNYQYQQKIDFIENNKIYIMSTAEFEQFKSKLRIESYQIFKNFVVILDI